MQLAVCSVIGAPADPGVWSGTPSYLLEALRRQHDGIHEIGPIEPWLIRGAQAVSWSTGRLLKQKIRWEVEPWVLRRLTRRVEKEARELGVDTVLAMGWHPLDPVGDVRFAFWGDATIAQRIGIAPYWTGLSVRSRRLVATVEGTSLRQVTPIYASDWAASSAEKFYGIQAKRIPFGANIAEPAAVPRRSPGTAPLRLLTVGVEWHRKGIDTAVMVLDYLARRLDAELDVAGVMPPDRSWNARTLGGTVGWTSRHSRISTDKPMCSCLPTRDEPFGIVFGEAAAYGCRW